MMWTDKPPNALIATQTGMTHFIQPSILSPTVTAMASDDNISVGVRTPR